MFQLNNSLIYSFTHFISSCLHVILLNILKKCLAGDLVHRDREEAGAERRSGLRFGTRWQMWQMGGSEFLENRNSGKQTGSGETNSSSGKSQ